MKERAPGKLDRLWDLLFPPKCPFCGALVERQTQLCADCARELPWLRGGQARVPVELTRGCVSALRYQDRVRDAVHGYKFRGRSGKAQALGTLIARSVEEAAVPFDLVSWPPLPPRRRRRRGYDQAELLARQVAFLLDRPAESTLHKEYRPAQSGLTDKAGRRANVLGAYTVPDPDRVRGKHILLVDDVLTTGSTLSECARMLRLAGAESVVCATLARAGK